MSGGVAFGAHRAHLNAPNRNSDHACVEAACRRSLAALKLDYLDLYLIHWPVVTGCTGAELAHSTAATWAAMEQLVDMGLVRSIGMSNFSRKKLAGLLEGGVRIRPAVLQVEAHPFFPNTPLIEWARSQGLHVTAYR
jgi:diketogulonate reductase-like aldo/keto reductase